MDTSRSFTLTVNSFIATHEPTACARCGCALMPGAPIAVLAETDIDGEGEVLGPDVLCRPCALRSLEEILYGQD